MSYWTFPERSIPLDESYDVIVVGGGPSGCTAAAAAAREGASTLLVEATSALGGMGTLGLVPAWCPFSNKKRIIYGGLAEKVFNASKSGMPHVDPERLDWVAIDPELLKRIYDDLVTNAGASVLFHTSLCAVDAGDGEAKTLVFANKEGMTAYKAKVYVDCTGDADLAAWSGSDFELGDVKGELQPATHCFMLSNVDTSAYLHGHRPLKSRLMVQNVLDRYPSLADIHLCNSLIGPDTVGFNAGHLWKVDNTIPGNLSNALMAGRKLAMDFRDALAECVPQAFGNAFLAATGSLLGIRETRRIVGDYVLTIDDYLNRRTFDDEICRNAYPIDIHTASSEVGASNRGEVSAMDRFEQYAPGESHGIPYRCLCPKGVRNVLVAGRSISTERSVQGSTRVMPPCLCMGEAAGVAAALAAKEEGDVHAVDTEVLRTRLREEGAYLP